MKPYNDNEKLRRLSISIPSFLSDLADDNSATHPLQYDIILPFYHTFWIFDMIMVRVIIVLNNLRVSTNNIIINNYSLLFSTLQTNRHYTYAAKHKTQYLPTQLFFYDQNMSIGFVGVVEHWLCWCSWSSIKVRHV